MTHHVHPAATPATGAAMMRAMMMQMMQSQPRF
ncbi:hypothetical protein FHX50_001972 [Helcobacillus massiliensis]|uniref:Uncharacterized protein n=1 Tax=Helcobacillus massiliensis TaxID=521392 RepID=A0A839QVC6_9MICO|nr:hypothetical protein [Helcobacillus massiliensis]